LLLRVFDEQAVAWLVAVRQRVDPRSFRLRLDLVAGASYDLRDSDSAFDGLAGPAAAYMSLATAFWRTAS
jgi:hypothetical protein